MQCKVCRSPDVYQISGELTLTPRQIENLSSDPVYVCESVLVCPHCGFAEITIPPQELQKLNKLKKFKTASRS